MDIYITNLWEIVQDRRLSLIFRPFINPRQSRFRSRPESRPIVRAFYWVLTLILLCPVTVNAADKDKKSEFGTAISTGE